MKGLNYFKKTTSMKDFMKEMHELDEWATRKMNEEEEEDTGDEDIFGGDEETGDEETGDEGDKKDEPDDEESKEESEEENFVKLFDDEDFNTAFKVATKQYISEKLLEDEFNSFTVLPFLEFSFKEDVYGINIEFESAVNINVDSEGKVVEKDIPNVELVKYKTPEMDNIKVLEDEIGKETITMYVTEAIDEIENIPR